MNAASLDQSLLRIVTAPPPTTIDQVVSMMQSMDGALPGGHGLKWFNQLYLLVTKQVQDPAGGSFSTPRFSTPRFSAPEWVDRLDVVFANFYFRAVGDFLSQSGSVPSAWTALFEAEQRAGVDRIQFALAGMNAHINHDLALALLQTNEEMRLAPTQDSSEHGDYEQVNDLLEAVLPKALEFLATGILGELAQDTGKIGRLLAIWDVRAARDLAWDFGDHLRNLSGPLRQAALDAQDKIIGALGRGLLLPIQ